MSHFKAKMHQVRFLFIRPFFSTQSTSCSDVRRRHGVTAEIAVDVVAVWICTSIRASVNGVWDYINTNVGRQNRLHLAPKNLGFRFSAVLTNNRGFRFRFGNRHSTTIRLAQCWNLLLTQYTLTLRIMVVWTWILSNASSPAAIKCYSQRECDCTEYGESSTRDMCSTDNTDCGTKICKWHPIPTLNNWHCQVCLICHTQLMLVSSTFSTNDLRWHSTAI